MNDLSPKAKTGVFAGFLAVLTLFVGTQGLPFAQWAFGEFKGLFGLPLTQPLLVAILTGSLAPAWLPYAMPPSCPRKVALRITRLFGFALAFVMFAWRYPSAIGVQYGLLAGTSAFAVWTTLSNFVYHRWPSLMPASLVDVDVFCEHVRVAALAEGRRQALKQVQQWAKAEAAEDSALAKRVASALGPDA